MMVASSAYAYEEEPLCVSPGMSCSSSTDICCSTGQMCGYTLTCPMKNAPMCVLPGLVCDDVYDICCADGQYCGGSLICR